MGPDPKFLGVSAYASGARTPRPVRYDVPLFGPGNSENVRRARRSEGNARLTTAEGRIGQNRRRRHAIRSGHGAK